MFPYLEYIEERGQCSGTDLIAVILQQYFLHTSIVFLAGCVSVLLADTTSNTSYILETTPPQKPRPGGDVGNEYVQVRSTNTPSPPDVVWSGLFPARGECLDGAGARRGYNERGSADFAVGFFVVY